MQRHIKAETKMLILREHLENQVPMADLAEKYHVNVNSIMNWKKKLFESGAAIFETSKGGTNNGQDESITRLESEVRRKEGVIAELAEELTALKKSISGGR
jgi:transposase-like protein